ncbi:metallophosphoesterase family protein [Pseudosulfitobacter koreensis]
MIVSDMGQRDGPLLIFGGPYSNVQATRALLAVAAARGIGGDHMLCTGDIVAYCGAPAATVAAIRAAGCAVVAGNCERQLAAGAPDCGCGFADGSACDLLSAGWYGFARARVSAQDAAWMGQLPDIVTFRHQGARYAAVHGGATDIARFIWPDSDDAVFAQEWVAVEAACGPVDHIIAGHCGIPFIRTLPQGRWINAGVIGMPPHDGRQQTRFAVLDGGDVQIMRLDYDVAGAIYDMCSAGLTQGYDSALRRGYWPSEDVLPETLRVPSLASG